MMETNAPPTNERPQMLVRTRDRRIVAGVASGIADRLDIPLWLVRVAFVVLAFAGGLGLALYAAGWLLIRDEDEDEPLAVRAIQRVDGVAGWLGVGLVGLAALILLENLDILRGDLAAAVVLAVIGVLLYRGDLQRTTQSATDVSGPASSDATAPPAETSTSFVASTAESGGEILGAELPADSEPDDASTAAAAPTDTEVEPMIETTELSTSATTTTLRPARPPARPPRERSSLGLLTFGLGFIVLGVIGLFDSLLDTFDPTARHYWSGALVITGLGLLVGTWLGRARGLIALGVVLVPIVFFSPLAELDVVGTVGERTSEPASVSAIEPVYDLGAGSLTIDFRDVDFAGASVETRAEVGIGELVIIVPDDVEVRASGDVGIGEAVVFGSTRNGIGPSLTRTQEGDDGVLELDAEVGIGTLTIRSGRGTDGDEAANADLRPTTLEPAYDFGDGNTMLDLTDVDLTSRPVSSRIALDDGTLSVVLPGDVGIALESQVDEGIYSFLGDQTVGVDIRDLQTINPEEPVSLILDISVDQGVLIIREEQP